MPVCTRIVVCFRSAFLRTTRASAQRHRETTMRPAWRFRPRRPRVALSPSGRLDSARTAEVGEVRIERARAPHVSYKLNQVRCVPRSLELDEQVRVVTGTLRLKAHNWPARRPGDDVCAIRPSVLDDRRDPATAGSDLEDGPRERSTGRPSPTVGQPQPGGRRRDRSVRPRKPCPAVSREVRCAHVATGRGHERHAVRLRERQCLLVR